jgi:hypothetical protein
MTFAQVKRIVLVTVALVGLSATSAHALPKTVAKVWQNTGKFHGKLQRSALNFVRLNPFMRTSFNDPARVSEGYAAASTYQAGRALRAYMVGNQLLGAARQASSSYLLGVAEGLRGPESTKAQPASPTTTKK